MIRDEKVDWRLLFILSDMSESTDDSQKVCEAVAVLEIFYMTLKHNHNEFHYEFVREQSLWRYLWCDFECNWQILEDVPLYFMLKEHDCKRSCEDLYTKNNLFAWNSNCHNVESEITVYLVILNQHNVHFKD